MKKIYGILGGAFLLVALSVSCKKQDTTPTPTPDPKGTTSTLNLDLTGTFDELKAMQFDEEDVANKIKLSPAGDWKTYCFLRKEGQSFVGVATVEFKAERDGAKIKLTPKSKSVAVTGIPQGMGPKKNENWYILGIAGGGELISGTSRVSFEYKYPSDDQLPKNQIRVPLASSWTKVKVLSDNYLEANLKFKPKGSLLRVRIINRLSSPVNPEYFSLTSSVASRDGYFDMSSGTVSDGKEPQWVFIDQPSKHNPYYAEIPVDELIPSSPSGSDKFATYRLMWVMLDPNASGGETKISSLKFKLHRYGDPATPTPGVERPPFSVKLKAEKMSNGKTHRINVELIRYKTSTEYIAPRNVGLVSRTFAIDNSVTTSGYYRLPISNVKNVIPRGYHLPNENEWQALFSPSFQHIKLDQSPSINETPQTIREEVEINHEKNSFMSSYVSKRYKNNTKTITYAVRFQPATSTADPNFPPYGRKDKIAVFRYEILDDDQMAPEDRVNNLGRGKQLRVTSRFIGTDINIGAIANEEFWRSSTTEQISIVFPLCGYVDNPSVDPNAFPDKRSEAQMRGLVTAWEVLAQGYYWSVRKDGKPSNQRMDTKHTNAYPINETAQDMYVIRPFTNSLD